MCVCKISFAFHLKISICLKLLRSASFLPLPSKRLFYTFLTILIMLFVSWPPFFLKFALLNITLWTIKSMGFNLSIVWFFSSLQYHTEFFHCLWNYCASPFILSQNPWKAFYLFAVSIVLYFPKCHINTVSHTLCSISKLVFFT